ncbi:hypothetical protein BC937DRAFT_92513 [Endogone sp. FLAS-F59071]|nr:hypothetical protein BC937DRAFT_92513 [Endogone sp. FLAS-F59071]|eukprot:RUS23095.1 hypothetical protein BC937DRAFT_92513 [Endogone sp. FLAS-F59071]
MADHDIRPSGSSNPLPIDMPTDDFVPVEDAYEEVFRLYTEGPFPSLPSRHHWHCPLRLVCLFRPPLPVAFPAQPSHHSRLRMWSHGARARPARRTCHMPEMLPLLLKNMRRNLQIAELVWSEHIDREILGDKWDYVVACDCNTLFSAQFDRSYND